MMVIVVLVLDDDVVRKSERNSMEREFYTREIV
jgi:hypothetical protein